MSIVPTDPKAKKAPEPKRVLGRGLDALLPAATATAAAVVDSEFQRVPIERLIPQAGQPRKHFDDAALEELATSLKNQGMIQPIVARRTNDGLEIVAGERRWRAAQRAGLFEVPVVIKDVAPNAAFELALVENLQRTDLDPIETAEAYQRLLDEHGYSQETLATRIGKNRATITNTLRLLKLAPAIQHRVVAGELSEGHARALLGAPDDAERLRLAQSAVEHGWSVRDTEAAARKSAGRASPDAAAAEAPRADDAAAKSNANVRDVEKRLAAALGMRVNVRTKAGGAGVVEVAFDSLDQLDGFLARLLGD